MKDEDRASRDSTKAFDPMNSSPHVTTHFGSHIAAAHAPNGADPTDHAVVVQAWGAGALPLEALAKSRPSTVFALLRGDKNSGDMCLFAPR